MGATRHQRLSLQWSRENETSDIWELLEFGPTRNELANSKRSLMEDI